MTTVSLELHIPTKYGRFASLNGSYFDTVSTDITWDQFFSFVADTKTKKNLEECDFVITKRPGRGRRREHHFSEKIHEFIKTFNTNEEIYAVWLKPLRVSSDDDYSAQGSSGPSTKEDDFSGYVHLTFSPIPPPPPMSDSSGGFKRVSEADYDNKPAKSPRLCEAVLGTSADSLEKVEVVPVDGIESNVSSDLSKDSKENELVESLQVETGSLNAEDFNRNLEGNDKTKDQELGKLQDESSVAGGVLGENDRGNYYEDAEGNQYGNIQDIETTNEEDVNAYKIPQINREETETQIQNLHEIGTSAEDLNLINDDGNRNSIDGTILDGIGAAGGQLNENSKEADKETSNQRGVEQVSENSIVIKQEDENDDVEIVYVKNKSDGRPSGKKKTKVPNSDGQEEKCEIKAVNILKAENISKEESFKIKLKSKMARVNLVLRIPSKYAQFLTFPEELNGLTAIVSKAITWDKFFTLTVDAKTCEELKTFGFRIVGKSARGRCRGHRLSEKIAVFINTFSEKQDVYKVHVRTNSSHFEVLRKSKINPNPIDGEISRSLPLQPRSPAMSHGGGSGVLKKVSQQDHDDDKPAKSSRLCDAPLGTPTPAYNMESLQNEALFYWCPKYWNTLPPPIQLTRSSAIFDGQTGSLNAENFNGNWEGNYGTKDQEGIGGEVAEAQEESSEFAGGVPGENATGNYSEDAGGNEFGNSQEEEEYIDVETVDVDDDKNPQINSATLLRKDTQTQIQNSYELGTSVEKINEINDNGNENPTDLNEKDGTLCGNRGADSQLENSEMIDKEPDNQGGVEQIIPENPIVIKQEDENDDVQTKEVINKSDVQSSVKKEVEGPNLDGQEEKCKSKVDISTLKAENIKKEDKFEEGKSKFLLELKNLSNDDFQAFQTELKQLESMQGKSRTILRGKAKHTLFFLFEFVMGSQNLQECSDEVQNKLKDSRVEKISNEIKRLFEEKELGNILSPDLAFFLMDSFC